MKSARAHHVYFPARRVTEVLGARRPKPPRRAEALVENCGARAALKFRASDAPHNAWQYFAVTNHADTKYGWAKNAICNFVTNA